MAALEDRVEAAVVVEGVAVVAGEMERETGVEPATLCLGSMISGRCGDRGRAGWPAAPPHLLGPIRAHSGTRSGPEVGDAGEHLIAGGEGVVALGGLGAAVGGGVAAKAEIEQRGGSSRPRMIADPRVSSLGWTFGFCQISGIVSVA